MTTTGYTAEHIAFRAAAKFCSLCGMSFLYADNPDFPNHIRTIEHIIPRRQGGSNDFVNLSVSHRACNNKRGATIGMGPVYCTATGKPLSLAKRAEIVNVADGNRRAHEEKRKLRLEKMVAANAYPPRMTISKAVFDDLVARIGT